MKKFLLVLLFSPLIGLGQGKTILTSSRIFPKSDKIQEFDKALANHSQKYHTGDLKWRVWSIESGPDAGGYMITEGPSSWENLDSRGDISTEHTNDWEKNVLPLTDGRYQNHYYSFQAEMSTVQMTDYADKIVINHMTARPGMINALQALVSKQKKAWEAGSESIAVYSVAASGTPGYIVVTRLKNGLKELAPDYRKPFAERMNDAYGAGSMDAWLKDYTAAVGNRWSELLVYKPKLSSK